eukprot:TRINITY_DN7994_c0_g1_i15.p1 TRINITY_DN7994_c0_g1~~TRINITY_DN7994_c0_g1_i15.p1  ORF type:complete len:443 (-),score=123.48 TRINITY_DN7994_c0_g1_i15:52-1224(-)
MCESKPKNLVKKKEKKVPSVCPILDSPEHQTIQKEVGQDAPLDILAGYILDSGIKVQAVALQTNISVFRANLGIISRKDLPKAKDLDPEIKIGKFSARDDEIILENWSHLYKHTHGKLDLEENDTIKEIFENTKKDKGLKNNIVGYYLSQGLADIRLATLVFHRARVLLCARKGEFTTEEDKVILDFVEEEGRKWSALAKQLGRTRGDTVKDRYDVLTNDYEGGSYTLSEDKIILSEVFAVDRDGKNITDEDWKRIAGKLKRNPQYVHHHWLYTLEPVLTRYQAGTLNMAVKKVLLDHLVENNMDYTQDVDWKELAKLPKFAGSTSSYLSRQLSSMRVTTRAMSPELSPVELTTGAIQSWYNNSQRRPNIKKEEYQEELVAVYKKIITDV